MKPSTIDELAQNANLLKAIHESLPELETEFAKIQTLFDHDVSNERFSVAINCFYYIFDFIPLMSLELRPGQMQLFRSRPNKKNELFSKQTDISYNSTNPEIIQAGRFNQPGKAAFYASLPVQKGKVEASGSACLETCKGLTDQENPVDLIDFTIGRWDVIKPFHVVNICFAEDHLQYSPDLGYAVASFFDNIKKTLSPESFAFVHRFLIFFSEMSGRQSLQQREYYILTAFYFALGCYYKDKKQEDVYGLIFPSAATERNGLNIVMTPEAVDLHLELDVVMMYRYFRSDKIFVADRCSDMVKAKDGEFSITGFQQIPDRKKYG
jgi:RES domain-containing protein